MLKMPFLFGNISKNQDAFSVRTQDGTKRKVLGKKDILMTLSITGAEIVIQRKDKPTHFEVADSRNLILFLKQKLREPGINFYLASNIFELYKTELAKVFESRVLHIAHPSSTRLRPQTTSGASSSTSSESSSTHTQRVSNVVEMDEYENDESSTRPIGLFEWLGHNSHTTAEVICKNDVRKKYLTEARNNSSDFKNKCPAPLFEEFLGKLDCTPDDQRKKCARRLLLFTHPDKFQNPLEKGCASEMYKHISDAKSEMETTYDMQAACQWNFTVFT